MSANKLNVISQNNKSVLVGSGELYAMKYTAEMYQKGTADIKTENMTDLGFIKEDAEIKASSELHEISAANAGVIGTIGGKKSVEFNTGIMEWNLENVANFLTGSEVEKSRDGKALTYFYSDTDKAPDVFLRFVSEDEAAKKRITLDMYRGNFMGELDLNFNGEDPVSFDYNFKLLSTEVNDKPRYFSIKEEDLTEATDDTVTSEQAKDTAKTVK